MGTCPCRQRAARFTTGALLALQLSFIASAPHHSATAESGNASADAAIVSRPVAAGPAEVRRSTIIGVYDITTLETSRRYLRELCHSAAVQRGREPTAPLWPEEVTPADAPSRPSGTTARTRTAALATKHHEQATSPTSETTARTHTAALTGAVGRQTTPRTEEATLRSGGKTAVEAQGSARAPVAATSEEQASAVLEKPSETRPAQGQQAQKAQQPMRLQQTDAKRLLREAGLTWFSSGKCANRNGPHCTSLEAVRSATVSSAIELKRRSGCPLVVTGGTEVGHAPGPYSHYEGYKLDIKPNACINRYITKNYPLQGVRGDGARLYGQSATSGPLFAREADHWDILFR
ncbi:hypothetical protein [Streptosporangium sp. NPDC050280]|uniref:hypothetical protein n=1 Tax=unclassified Streptosporangium TaxID=2632669 RepID=UPI0034242919